MMQQMTGMSDYCKPDWLNAEHKTGTTIVAAKFDGGIYIGADSRTSTGSYVANRVTDKLTPVTDLIYCCRSGSAADTQAIADIVKYYVDFHQSEIGKPASVKTAATFFRELCYEYRDSLSAGILVSGYDADKGFQIYSIPIGGMLQEQDVAIGGSGSTYLYGFVDNTFKPNMKKEECRNFVATAIGLAMSRDGSSGGVIRLGCITEKGIEREVITEPNLPVQA